MSANDWLVIAIAAHAVTSAVPLILAGIGELIAERAGIVNVGIEGLMLTGAIAGFAGATLSGSALCGLTAAVLAATALSAIFALLAIHARANQIVAGMAINVFAVGASGSLYHLLQIHGHQELPMDAGFVRSGWWWCGQGVHDWLQQIPVFGPIIFDQYALAYVTALAVILVAWILARTRTGLIVRALGEAPESCDAAGIRVRAWRFGCVVFAGSCAGAAGAYLSIMRTHSFATEMTGGQGFVVLALVIFGRWRIAGLVAGCLLFGAIESLQQHLQGLGLNSWLPYQLFQVMPYVVALLALAMLSRAAPGPAALGRPWPEQH